MRSETDAIIAINWVKLAAAIIIVLLNYRHGHVTVSCITQESLLREDGESSEMLPKKVWSFNFFGRKFSGVLLNSALGYRKSRNDFFWTTFRRKVLDYEISVS